jgi:hypothetical protein
LRHFAAVQQLGFRSSQTSVPHNEANFGIGALVSDRALTWLETHATLLDATHLRCPFSALVRCAGYDSKTKTRNVIGSVAHTQLRLWRPISIT